MCKVSKNWSKTSISLLRVGKIYFPYFQASDGFGDSLGVKSIFWFSTTLFDVNFMISTYSLLG